MALAHIERAKQFQEQSSFSKKWKKRFKEAVFSVGNGAFVSGFSDAPLSDGSLVNSIRVIGTEQPPEARCI